MNRPSSRTSAMRCFSSGRSGAYCALTSTSGICTTGSQSIGAPSPPDNVRRERNDSCDEGDIRVAERVVEPLPVRAEGPADAREREGPDRRAGERHDGVAPERRAADARWNGDERARDGCDPADEHGPVPPPFEPAL